MSNTHGIVMKSNDNVCTVVETVNAGMTITADCSGKKIATQVRDNIPAGHKFAIQPIRKGEKVFKYGEVIGLATQDIQMGQYVHVHNIESCRGRGDK